MRERKRDRGILLLQVALATTLAGHWIANALFDRDQYEGASERLLAHLNDPALAQTALTLIGIGALALWGRRRSAGGRAPLLQGAGRAKLLLLLTAIQLGLFMGMEISERAAIGELYGEPFNLGIFGEGLSAELVVALGSALVLALAGAVTAKVVRLIRPTGASIAAAAPVALPRSEPARRPLVLAGAGGVRAPPTI